MALRTDFATKNSEYLVFCCSTHLLSKVTVRLVEAEKIVDSTLNSIRGNN